MRALAFSLAALLLAGCASAPEPAPAEGGAGWSFTALDGRTYTADEPPRNATVLFFMATWCGSCRSKAPMLATVQDAYAERNVSFFSLDFDPRESREEISAWQARYGHDWPHALDEGLRLQRHFGVRAQSSVVVLDAQGEVVRLFGYGEVTEPTLRLALDDALAGGSA